MASAGAAVTLAGTGMEVVVVEGGGATVAIRNTSDITHFQLRNMNILKYYFFTIA